MVPASAMSVHNVRRFLIGQGLSNIGTFFQVVAQALLVLDLTDSGFALGAAIGIQFLPVLLFGPLAGVVLDRLRIPRLLTITAALAGLKALASGVLTSTGHINVAWILCLSFALGVVQVGDRAGAQRKAYGDRVMVDGLDLDLDVGLGQVVGLFGADGAGERRRSSASRG